MAQHAKLSPSASSRWMNCPGSVALCATVPKTSSSWADEGSAAHSLAECCVVKGHNASHYLGWWAGLNSRGAGFLVKEKPSNLTSYEVTEEMAEAVQVYIDAVKEVKGDGKAEVKVDLERWVPGMFGRVDYAVCEWSTKTLHVFDYKHGAGVLVNPEENTQAMCYALGAMNILPQNDRDRIEQVRIVIVQPRHRNGGVMDWTISKADLAKWAKEELVPAARRAQEKDAPLNPGDKQCKFCDAKSVCPALMDKALTVARVAFKDVVSPGTITLPSPADLAPDQLANVLDFSELLSSWVSSVAMHAEELAKRGTIIPGRKLVRKTTRRAWKDEGATAKALAHFGEALYERKLKSPAQVEKLVKGKEAKDALATLWEQPEGELTLAPVTDRRQEVRPNALAAFFDDL